MLFMKIKTDFATFDLFVFLFYLPTQILTRSKFRNNGQARADATFRVLGNDATFLLQVCKPDLTG